MPPAYQPPDENGIVTSKMKLKYSTRSSFFPLIHAAFDSQGSCPNERDPVKVELSQQGYDGQVIVELSPQSRDEFEADWEGNDETRFPARIRAAATVLRDRKCFGRYLISHDQGRLTILQVP
jgi:hypothetical protein